MPSEAAGLVSLVGAGPGDPGLLTVRGREVLERADLVLYDGLVNPELLTLARGRCERTARVVQDGSRRIDQAEVNRRLIEAGRQGLRVCRLKGGDPYIFGRGSEEAAALQAAGVPFEVVPGVTAATASGAYAGFSLTHRDIASAVALVTGHERPGKPASMLDWPALAAFPGTLVFYMGLPRLPAIAERLVAAGKPPTTPAAVVSHASLPTQRVLAGTLATLAQQAANETLQAPTLIVVGECVQLREQLAWYERLPLFGLSIGVCRAEHQAGDAVRTIAGRGGRGVVVPMLAIAPPDDWDDFDGTLRNRLDGFDAVALTSSNAVAALAARLEVLALDARVFAGCRLACVGPATADALRALGLQADLIAAVPGGAALAEELVSAGARAVWFPKAEAASPDLPAHLRAAGVTVHETIAYRSHPVTELPDEVLADLDWVALTSSQIAETFAAALADRRSPRLAAISENVAAAAKRAGLQVDAVAETAGWPSLLDAIAAAR